jgi:hypothetical protein
MGSAMQTLPLGDLAGTPWSLSPLWFLAMALAIPGLVWLALAWRRAVLECPNRIRRAGVKEMRRLLKNLQRAEKSPQPVHLHAWLRATARVWDVRTSAPCVSEVSQAAHALTGDASVSSRWREMWQATEHGLYAANAQPARDWVKRAADVATSVGMPKRERFFPNRLGHWLPSIGIAVFLTACLIPPAIDADVPWSAPPVTEAPSPIIEEPASVETSSEQMSPEAVAAEEAPAVPLSPEVQQVAQAALNVHWNDWAAHHNLAAFQIQEGELNLAIAHATAAFVQHPAAASTRETLLVALGDTPGVDPNLRRLLSGAWYERAPALLSPAGWQRVALAAGLIVAAGLSLMVFALYAPQGSRFTPRHLSLAGRGGFAIGALLSIVAISSWNAYGALNQPAAAILVQGVNMSPVPTDLVPVEETSPLVAGAVVLTHRTFLSWRQVSTASDASGWIRSNAMMPLYASR